ncbi:Methyltransferase type 11 [Rhodospirillaceae bacterium LM-1]|nr:Methyltransferase type 11 [Rhodospirillaceae bacterium LM-1]
MTQHQSLRINFGCGQFPKSGFVNVDVDPSAKADVFHDLERFPYPFDDASATHVEMDHVLEHLNNPMAVMREMDRILRPGATLIIRVPHFTRAFTHWDHKRGYDVSFPLYFDPDFVGGYSGIRFESVSTRLIWLAQRELKRKTVGPAAYYVACCLAFAFDFIGNLNLFVTSRLLSFYVGGFDEIEFVFRKPAA